MKNILNVLGTVLLVLVTIALSWCATSFIYWLITLCFGIEWSVLHATGVWLILILVSSSISGSKMPLKN